MTGKADSFFSIEEKEFIRNAVKCAESATSGEIATMVVDASDRYEEARVTAAILLAALLSLALSIATLHLTVWTYLPLTIILYFPAKRLISGFPRLALPFISGKRRQEAVKDRAVRAFYEKGLYRTKHQTGILIFISIFERKVWILADRGINARIEPEEWLRLTRLLTAGLRSNKACEALCSVIRQCGEMLACHFPASDKNLNELPDGIITEGKME